MEEKKKDSSQQVALGSETTLRNSMKLGSSSHHKTSHHETPRREFKSNILNNI